jgi:hypothetical protein
MRVGPEHAAQEGRDVLRSPASRLGVAADGRPAREAAASAPARGGDDVFPGATARDREVVEAARQNGSSAV